MKRGVRIFGFADLANVWFGFSVFAFKLKLRFFGFGGLARFSRFLDSSFCQQQWRFF